MVQRRPHGPRANQTGYSLRRHGAPGESRKGCHRTRASKAGQRSPKHPSRWNAAADGSCRVRRPGRHSPGWMLLNNSGRSHDSRCPDPGAGSRLFRVKPGLLAHARPPNWWRATRVGAPGLSGPIARDRICGVGQSGNASAFQAEVTSSILVLRSITFLREAPPGVGIRLLTGTRWVRVPVPQPTCLYTGGWSATVDRTRAGFESRWRRQFCPGPWR